MIRLVYSQNREREGPFREVQRGLMVVSFVDLLTGFDGLDGRFPQCSKKKAR